MRRLKKKRGKKIRNVPALIPCQIEESCKTSMDESLIKEEEEEALKMCEQFSFSCVTENVSRLWLYNHQKQKLTKTENYN